LAKKPEQRPQTPAELLQELEKIGPALAQSASGAKQNQARKLANPGRQAEAAPTVPVIQTEAAPPSPGRPARAAPPVPGRQTRGVPAHRPVRQAPLPDLGRGDKTARPTRKMQAAQLAPRATSPNQTS